MKVVLKKLIYACSKIFHIFPIKNNKVFFYCFAGNVFGYDQKAFLDWCKENNVEYDFVFGSSSSFADKEENLRCVRIVKKDSIKKFIKKVGKAYKKKIGYEADFYVVKLGNGPKRIY